MKFPSTKNAGCIEVPTTPFFCLRRQTMIEAKVNDVQKSSDISQGPRLHRPFRVSGPMVSHNYVVCLTTTNEEVLRVLPPTLHSMAAGTCSITSQKRWNMPAHSLSRARSGYHCKCWSKKCTGWPSYFQKAHAPGSHPIFGMSLVMVQKDIPKIGW